MDTKAKILFLTKSGQIIIHSKLTNTQTAWRESKPWSWMNTTETKPGVI